MEENAPSFTRGRKWRIGLNVGIAMLSAFALVVMANYLAARHGIRYDWSNAAANKLSPQTIRALNALTNTVKVVVFYDRREPLFGAVTGLLKDYQLRNPKLELEFIDYRYPGRAELIRSQYKLGSRGEENRIIFDCNGRVRSVLGSELSEFAFGEDKQIRRAGFKGEQLFTSALISVTTPRRAKAYFLTGHGELDAESESDNSGMSRFAKMLMESDVELAVLDSLPNRDVPEDCSLLIIAGPATKFAQEELDRIDRYLGKGGRMLALFPVLNDRSPVTGLERLLASWNVEVGIDIVQDRERSAANNDFLVVASQFGPHQITRPLLRSRIDFVAPRLVGARSVRTARADAPRATELAFTGPQGWALSRLDEKGTREVERTGAIPLATAVEKGGIQGVAAEGATRIVAVGSSMSFANAVFPSAANADFANLAVNWLLNRDVFLADLPPRAITEYTITATEKQMETLRWLFLFGAPAGALAVGGIVWLRRRS